MYTTSNLDLRKAIRESGLCAYEVADCIGMTETSFSRMMRKELTPERKQQILDAIQRRKMETDANEQNKIQN